MRLVRNVTFVTANLGRNATRNEFVSNVHRLAHKFDKQATFLGFQEIDEGDRVEEMDFLRKVFSDTHRFIGVHTHCPIAVPRSFGVSVAEIVPASDGVKGLQPDRHVVKVVAFPAKLKTKRKLVVLNTHIGRDIPQLRDERRDSMRVLRDEYDNHRPTVLMLDANTEQFPQLEKGEKRLASARVDYIRAIERRDVRIRLINRGSVNLVGDGHNAEFANTQITWP